MRTLALTLALMLLPSLGGSQAVSDANFVFRTQTSGYLYLPDGSRIVIPAGSELDACGQWDYALSTRYVDFPLCTTERPIFQDGFE